MRALLLAFAAFLLSCDSDDVPVRPAGKITQNGEATTQVASVTNLHAAFDGTEDAPAILLSWSPPEDTEGMTGDYNLRYKLSSSQYYRMSSTRDSSLRVSGLVMGDVYDWGVQTEALLFQGYSHSAWVDSTFTVSLTEGLTDNEDDTTDETANTENTENEPSSSDGDDDDSQSEFISDPDYEPGLETISTARIEDLQCALDGVWRPWLHWNGSECVDACVGTGQVPGHLGWDGLNNRCGCDNENGYAYNSANGRCELIRQPEENPIEVDPNCEGTAPRVLNVDVGNHGSNTVVWGAPNRCADNTCTIGDGGESCQVPEVSNSYPWSHTHKVCEQVVQGVEHTHNMGRKTYGGRDCGLGIEEDCSAYGNFCVRTEQTVPYGHSANELFADMTPAHNCEEVYQTKHVHGWSASVSVTTHSHPSGSHGTDWCYSDESAVCGGDGTWSCE